MVLFVAILMVLSMRIKRNDIATAKYTHTETVDSEGNSSSTWISAGNVSADWQPIGSKTALEKYGVSTIGQDVWLVFCDTKTDHPIGSCAIKDGINYQCQGQKTWYTHIECIMVPYSGKFV